jgi:peptide deformylase
MKLITYPDDSLKKALPEFSFNSGIDAALIERQMIEVMIKNRGIGLSANQVGLEFRVLVMRPQNVAMLPFAMFNPKIVAVSEETVAGEEGCLSFPGLYLPVKRPQSVMLQYLDREGNLCIIELTGIDARCALHEIDHLDGVCFTDKISKLKLDRALKKQRKLNGRTKR